MSGGLAPRSICRVAWLCRTTVGGYSSGMAPERTPRSKSGQPGALAAAAQ
jgi:hypothetical protein